MFRAISSVSPAAGPEAGATEAHTIVGTGFLTTTAVTIGGGTATYTVTDDSHIAVSAIPSHGSTGVVGLRRHGVGCCKRARTPTRW